MNRFLRTFRGYETPRFNIIGRRRRWVAFSGSLMVVSVIALLTVGLNLSIDFRGGALLRYPNTAGLSTADVRSTLAEYGRADSEIQVVGAQEVSIRTASLAELGDQRDDLLQDLASQAGVTTQDIDLQDVGPTWGGQISRKAIQGLVVFLVLVSIYVIFRFEWKMAVAAQVALSHDLLGTAGVYALVGREVTPATIIAILTILGYSLYDTVVIFDRINENTESLALVQRETYGGAVNLSLNQTFMRSINTSLTTLLPISALLLFGGDTLKDFAFALLVGVGFGTYSSLFVAAPILAELKEREPRYQQLRLRAEQRVRSAGPAAVEAGGDAGAGESLEPATRAVARARPPARSGRAGSSKRKRRPPPKRRGR